MNKVTRVARRFDIGDRLSTAALVDAEIGDQRPLQVVATSPSDVVQFRQAGTSQ